MSSREVLYGAKAVAGDSFNKKVLAPKIDFFMWSNNEEFVGNNMNEIR